MRRNVSWPGGLCYISSNDSYHSEDGLGAQDRAAAASQGSALLCAAGPVLTLSFTLSSVQMTLRCLRLAFLAGLSISPQQSGASFPAAFFTDLFDARTANLLDQEDDPNSNLARTYPPGPFPGVSLGRVSAGVSRPPVVCAQPLGKAFNLTDTFPT